MKKTVSVLLSVLLVATAIFACGVVPASGAVNKTTKNVLVQDDFSSATAKTDWGNNTPKEADIIAEPGNSQNKCISIVRPAARAVALKSNTKYTVSFKIRGKEAATPLNGIMVTVCEDVRTADGILQWNAINGIGGVYDAARNNGDAQKSKDKDGDAFTCPGKWEKWGSATSVTWLDYEFSFTTETVNPNKQYFVNVISFNNVLLDNFVLYEQVTPTLPEPSSNGLLKNGDFSASYVGDLENLGTNLAKTNQIWAGNSKVIEDPTDPNNSCAVLDFSLMQYCPELKSNTEYYLTYRFKNNPETEGTNANFLLSVVESGTIKAVGNAARNDYKGNSTSEWKLVKTTFKTGELPAGKHYSFMISSPVTAKNILVDDIGLYELSALSVDADSYRGGKAEVSTPYANSGDTVTFTAKPDENCTFVGWLNGGDSTKPYVSTNPVYQTTVTDNLKLLAVFTQNGQNVSSDEFLNAGAENGNLSYWRNRYPEKSAQFTVDSTEKHSGNYSFKLSANEIGIYRVQSERGILLRPNCEYTVSVWVKTDDNGVARTGFFTGELEDYREGTNDLVFVGRNLRPDTKVTHQVGTVYSADSYYSSSSFTRASKWYTGADSNGWVEVKTTFVTSVVDAGCVLNITLGLQESLGTVWFDDLSVTYKPLDFSTKKTSANYCEWNVNRLRTRGFEKPLSATDLNAPQSWQIVKDGTAPEQEAYLKIPANSGVYVKEMTVDNMRWSVLAAFLKTNKAGTSYIGLTEKEPAQNADFANPETLGIYNSKPTTSWERTGWQMYANNFTKIWVVIYSGSNDVYLDQLQFFYGDFAHESDPNDTTPAAVYDYEGTGVLSDSLDVEYKAAMQQAFGAGSGAPVEYDGNTAATGDEKPVLPVMFILLSCAAVCALALRKGRVTNEK